jgi:hypothetical protein
LSEKQNINPKDRIGLIGKNKFGSLMEIVEYRSALDIWVKFIENGNLIHTEYKAFRKGEIKNPYDKSVYGVGYLGEGGYKGSINKKRAPQYMTWLSMMSRCYSEVYHKRHSTYIGCTVCEDWHNFQNFAAWYDKNYYEIDGQKMCLDKDILQKGNKEYSPNTCIFVPSKINNLFLKHNLNRGEFPLGVTFTKHENKYIAKCRNSEGKTIRIGGYDTPEKAIFAYKTTKEEIIKQIAVNYKEKIPSELYNVMIGYNVDIND